MNNRELLSDKRILLGVSGENTAYESANLARRLTKRGAEVDVVLGDEGKKFITPLTFEEITGRKVLEEAKIQGEEARLKDIVDKTDMVIIAPASFSFIGRLASNLDGGMLNTLVGLSDQPILIVPSMDRKLYSSQNVRRDLDGLRNRGFYLVEPNREEGDEKRRAELSLFPEPSRIIDRITEIFQEDSLLEGIKVLVTAGPTRKPFRSRNKPEISFRSSLGFELSHQARQMGAEVLLVSGPTDQIAPPGVGVVWTRNTEELDELLLEEISEHDLILMSASASDWEARATAGLFEEEKTKRLDLDIEEIPNVLKKLGKLKESEQFLVSVESGPEGDQISSEEIIEENNLDACFCRNQTDEPDTANSNLFSGKLQFRSEIEKEFHSQNVSRLSRGVLREVGKVFFGLSPVD